MTIRKETLDILGCRSNPDQSDPSPEGVTDLGSLQAALEDTGAMVEIGGPVRRPFPGTEDQIISINGQDVQDLEFGDQAAMEAEADLVSPDGTPVGNPMISWVSTPNFFRGGRLLVLCVGDHASTVDLLTAIFGVRFAGG